MTAIGEDNSSGRAIALPFAIVLGLVVLALGITGLVLADTYDPSVEHALLGNWVLSPEWYTAIKVASWLAVATGGASLILGAIGWSAGARGRLIATGIAAAVSGLVVLGLVVLVVTAERSDTGAGATEPAPSAEPVPVSSPDPFGGVVLCGGHGACLQDEQYVEPPVEGESCSRDRRCYGPGPDHGLALAKRALRAEGRGPSEGRGCRRGFRESAVA